MEMYKEADGGIHRWFPLFFDLSGWRILVVGCGKIACRRIQTLLGFGPGHVCVVARETGKSPEGWRDLPNMEICERGYHTEDLEGCQMVIAATDDEDLNRRIGEECRRRGILVNVASYRSLCDFHFPGVAVSGPITVGINAAGLDHSSAKKAREQIQIFLDQGGHR